MIEDGVNNRHRERLEFRTPAKVCHRGMSHIILQARLHQKWLVFKPVNGYLLARLLDVDVDAQLQRTKAAVPL